MFESSVEILILCFVQFAERLNDFFRLSVDKYIVFFTGRFGVSFGRSGVV